MTTPSAPAAIRGQVSPALRERPVIAVLRAPAPGDYDRVVDVLLENGVASIELTLTTPGTLEYLPSLLGRIRPAEVGVGTITSLDQARRAVDAGADYLVTPVVNLEVIAFAVGAGVPVFPGAMSPTEVFAAWDAGATAVKIFPAETVGPKFGAHLRGPFPDLQFIPSGGVALGDVPAWFAAGAVAVSLGGPLVGDALAGGSLDALAERARRAVELVGAGAGR